MKKRRLLLGGAACAVLLVLLATGLVVRRSRANESRAIEPDTVIMPLANGRFNNRAIDYKGKRYFYKVFLPHDYTPARKWPVIFALHGGKTRGVDNVVQAREGLANVVRLEAATFPAIVIFAQVPQVRGPDFIPVDLAMMDLEMKALHGDADRLYLAGSSFGGFTIYQMAYQYPHRFAAIVPVSSGIDLSIAGGARRRPGVDHDSVYAIVARRIRPMPVWIVHGELDEELGVEQARRIVRVFKENGVPVHYTELAGAPHSIFTRAYETPGLIPWLMEQRRGRTGS